MSASKSIFSQDPGYGKVRDICEALGYKSELKSSPRFYQVLSRPAAKHRQQYTNSSTDLTELPLSQDHPAVKSCASTFLIKFQHLFKDSQEALAFGWPIYSRDNDRILEELQRLMCTQEWLHRKNNSMQDIRNKKHPQDTLRKTTHDTTDDESNDENYPTPRCGAHDPGRFPRSHPIASAQAPSTTEVAKSDHSDGTSSSEGSDSRERVKRNVAIHLEFIYPLDGSKDDLSNDWVFKSEPWPNSVKPFVFRYLHEHQLYSAQKANLNAVHQFTRDLKNHLHITCNESEDLGLYERSKKFIASISGRWKQGGYGFLRNRIGVPTRTAAFEKAWLARRAIWMTLHPQPVAETIVVRSVSPSSSARGTQLKSGTKRQIDSTTPTCGHILSDPSGKCLYNNCSTSDKRQRTDLLSRVPIEVDAFVTEPKASSVQDLQANASSDNSHRQYNFNALPDVTATKEPPASSSPTVSKRKATLVGAKSHCQDNPISSSLSVIPPGPLASKANAESQAVEANHEKSKAPVASLLLILEKRRGTMDWDNSLSRKEWWNLSLADFFALVCSRSGQPEGSLLSLTLKYNWGDAGSFRDAFVIRKDDGDERWGRVKKRIKDLFLDARTELPGETQFEIWVKSGETTNLADMEDDDW